MCRGACLQDLRRRAMPSPRHPGDRLRAPAVHGARGDVTDLCVCTVLSGNQNFLLFCADASSSLAGSAARVLASLLLFGSLGCGHFACAFWDLGPRILRTMVSWPLVIPQSRKMRRPDGAGMAVEPLHYALLCLSSL